MDEPEGVFNGYFGLTHSNITFQLYYHDSLGIRAENLFLLHSPPSKGDKLLILIIFGRKKCYFIVRFENL